MIATPYYDIFISYSETDSAWVEGYLIDALKQAGIRYCSEECFTLGAVRIEQFEEAIRTSRRILLILSHAYLSNSENRFVKSLSQFYGIECSTWPVIPLYLESDLIIPNELRLLVSLDATNPRKWRIAIERLCKDLNVTFLEHSSIPKCPYLGMLSFNESDSNRFFGRSQEIDALLYRLHLSSFVTLVGQSGSGKSSLVNAGLIPAIRNSELFGPGKFIVYTMRPGSEPFSNLLAMLNINYDKSEGIIHNIFQSHLQDAKVLIFIDQLEELFTIANQRGDSINEEIIPFLESLLCLIRSPYCYIILAIRSDYYSDLKKSCLWHKIKHHRYEIEPLKGAGLREAIIKSAKSVDVLIEPALLDRIVADAAEEPGILPLVQETLVLLWERIERKLLPLDAYKTLLSILPHNSYKHRQSVLEVAIALHADAALGDLENEQQITIAQRIFLRLVQFGEGREDTRRQQSVSALQVDAEKLDLFNQVLEALVRRRLLTLSGEEHEEKKVDISHEALITAWPAFQEWVSVHGQGEKFRRRLIENAQEWAGYGKGKIGLLDKEIFDKASSWLNSTEANILGLDTISREYLKASKDAIIESSRKEEEAIERELNLTREKLEQEKIAKANEIKLRKVAQSRYIITSILVFLLTGVSIFAINQAYNSKKLAIESSMIASSSLHNTNKDIEALLELIKTGKLLNRKLFPKSDLHYRFNIHFTNLIEKLREKNRFKAHSPWVTSVSITPINGNLIASAGSDNTIKIWQRNGELLQVLTGHRDSVISVSFNRDNQTIASASLDNTIRLWRRNVDNTFIQYKSINHNNGIGVISFSPNGQYLASVGADKIIRIWSTEHGTLEGNIQNYHKPVVDISFSLDGKRVASVDEDGTIVIWNFLTSKIENKIQVNDRVYCIRFIDNQILASASENGSIKLWSLSGDLVKILNGHGDSVLYLDVSQDGKKIISASQDMTIKLWDVELGIVLQTFKGHTEGVSEAIFSPNNRTIISGSKDGTVRLWGIDGIFQRLKGTSFAFSPVNNNLITGDIEGFVKFWNPDNGKLVTKIPAHTQGITQVIFNSDGSTFASACENGEVKIWSINGKLLHNLKGHRGSVTDIQFSPYKQHIASSSIDKTVRIWHWNDDHIRLLSLLAHKDYVTSISFNPNRDSIATSSADGTIKVWGINGVLIRDIFAHEGGALSVNFSPNGNRIISSGTDRKIKIWRLNGDLVQVLSGHSDSISNINFNIEGDNFISVGGKDIKIWSVEGDLLSHIESTNNIFLDASISPNKKMLVSSNLEGIITLWNLELDDLLNLSCRWIYDYLAIRKDLNDKINCQNP